MGAYMFKINVLNLFKQKINPVSVEMFEHNGRKYIKRMPVQAKNDIVYLESKPLNGSTKAETALYDSFNKKIAYNNYDVYNLLGEIYGTYMHSLPNRRHQGLGEILRLASIIEMKENDSYKMNIFSLPEAIKFHHKYGFRPNVEKDSDIIEILKMLESQNYEDSFSTQAKDLLDDIYNNGCLDASIRHKLNGILDNYIKSHRIIAGSKLFGEGVDMVLTKNDVQSNANFYNKLFAKHKIDYKV